jgi:hypothetical protein
MPSWPMLPPLHREHAYIGAQIPPKSDETIN